MTITRYRSKFEAAVHAQIPNAQYEPTKIKFTQPAITRTYTPDFVLVTDAGKTVYIESKGRFMAADRAKLLMVRNSNPDLDIRILFYRAKEPIAKGSKTTVAMWADKNGFKWAEKHVPEEWKH